MDRKHLVWMEHSRREEHEANLSALMSQRKAEESVRQELLMQDVSNRENIRIADEVSSARRLAGFISDRYYYPY